MAPGVYGSNPDTRTLAVAFDDAFAEWVVLPTGGFLPHWPLVPKLSEAGDFIDLRSKGFFNAPMAPARPPILNTVQSVAAGDAVGSFGLANLQSNWSWVFNERIAAHFAGVVEAARENVTAHELAHQFNVNSGASLGHDIEDSWTTPGQACLMNADRDRTLGVVKMHSPFGAPTNDLACIRSHIDDLDNSIFCSEP